MNFDVNKEAAIANRGNWARLKNVMKRARQGEKLTIGFIGGSITQGCLSSVPETCYAYLVYDWWKKTFPMSTFEYCNAGIGATTSHLGAARVEEDLLSAKPDFVITEFSVNDECNSFFEETYEGLIRKIYSSSTHPGMLIVNNVVYTDGTNAQEIHNRIGAHYGIPCVSMQSSIYPEVEKGTFTSRDVTEDDLHPNDDGHALVTSIITYFLDKILKDLENDEIEPDYPTALTANRYESALRYRNKDLSYESDGFVLDESAQRDVSDCFKFGWSAGKPKAKLEFDVTGTEIAIQYKRSYERKCCNATVTIDGDANNAIVLDGNFDEDWGDKLELTVVAQQLEMKSHHIVIETENVSCEVPFYFVSVVAAGRK